MAPASAAVITTPTDAVVGVTLQGGILSGSDDSPSDEGADKIIDGDTGTKYLNFAKWNTGVLITPTLYLPVGGFEAFTANDAPERDPSSFSLYGTQVTGSLDFADYTPILVNQPLFDGSSDRFESSGLIPVNSSVAYRSYLVVFPTLSDPEVANSMQVSEIQLHGTVPEPSVAGLAGLALGALALRRPRRG